MSVVSISTGAGDGVAELEGMVMPPQLRRVEEDVFAGGGGVGDDDAEVARGVVFEGAGGFGFDGG